MATRNTIINGYPVDDSTQAVELIYESIKVIALHNPNADNHPDIFNIVLDIAKKAVQYNDAMTVIWLRNKCPAITKFMCVCAIEHDNPDLVELAYGRFCLSHNIKSEILYEAIAQRQSLQIFKWAMEIICIYCPIVEDDNTLSIIQIESMNYVPRPLRSGSGISQTGSAQESNLG